MLIYRTFLKLLIFSYLYILLSYTYSPELFVLVLLKGPERKTEGI